MSTKNKSTKKDTADKQVSQVPQVEETTNQVDINGLIKIFTHIVNLDVNSLYKENNTQEEYEDDLEEKNKLFLEITQLILHINNKRAEFVDLIVKIQQKYKSTYQLNNSVNLNEDNEDDTNKKDKLPNDTNDDDIDDVPIVDVKLKKDTLTKVEPGETLVEEVIKSKKTKKITKPSEAVIEDTEPVKPIIEKSTAKVEEVQDTKPKKKTTKKAVESTHVVEPTPVVEQPATEVKKKKVK
jgi:hypothetical protein